MASSTFLVQWKAIKVLGKRVGGHLHWNGSRRFRHDSWLTTHRLSLAELNNSCVLKVHVGSLFSAGPAAQAPLNSIITCVSIQYKAFLDLRRALITFFAAWNESSFKASRTETLGKGQRTLRSITSRHSESQDEIQGGYRWRFFSVWPETEKIAKPNRR